MRYGGPPQPNGRKVAGSGGTCGLGRTADGCVDSPIGMVQARPMGCLDLDAGFQGRSGRTGRARLAHRRDASWGGMTERSSRDGESCSVHSLPRPGRTKATVPAPRMRLCHPC